MHSNMKLAVQYQSVSALQPYPHNARTHSKRQIRQIADSIRTFGFTNPILLDRNNRIAAGHGRLEAAKLLGMGEVPTIALEDLSEEQIRAYILADNKLAENAGWDKDVLAIELQHLMDIEGLDLDVTITGFEIPEIDLILEGATRSDRGEEDDPEIDQSRASVSVAGDCWRLRDHRIFCGSSLDETSFESLLGKKRAHAVFTDPPYNVKIDGHVTGNGRTRHREFAMAAGEMTADEFAGFLDSCIRLLVNYSNTESVHYLCMDWRHIETLLAAGGKHYNQLLNLCVWVKDNGGMGSFYRSQHELVAVYRSGKKRHRNNIQLGRFGRNRTNVWQYPGVNTLSKSSDEGNLLALHPTVKPLKLVADALLDCTKRYDIVLDAFLGSGTTLIAAERVGRACYGLEIDPLYVDTAIRRWQDYTGSVAFHMAENRSFNELAERRKLE